MAGANYAVATGPERALLCIGCVGVALKGPAILAVIGEINRKVFTGPVGSERTPNACYNG